MMIKEEELKEVLESLNNKVKSRVQKDVDKLTDKEWDKILGPQEGLLTKEQQIEKKKQELFEDWPLDRIQETVVSAYGLITARLDTVLSSEENEKFSKEIQKLADKAKSKELFSKKEEGVPLAVQIGLTPFCLVCIHKIGNSYYEEDHYQESATIFSYLTMLHPFIPDFWVALGHANRMLGLYEESLAAYYFAGIIDEEDPYPFHCMAEMKEVYDGYKNR